MPVRGAAARLHAALLTWPHLTAAPHRFGGTEYRYGPKREIGHIHGDALVDLPFPTRVRDELVAAGRAEPHHLLADSGWVSLYLQAPEDVARALELFQLSYDLAARQKAPPADESR